MDIKKHTSQFYFRQHRKPLQSYGERARVNPEKDISIEKSREILSCSRFEKMESFIELSNVRGRQLTRPNSAGTLISKKTVESTKSVDRVASIYGKSLIQKQYCVSLKHSKSFNTSLPVSESIMTPHKRFQMGKDPMKSWSLEKLPTRAKKSRSPSPSKRIKPLEIDLLKNLSNKFKDEIRKLNQRLDEKSKEYVDNTQAEQTLKFEENDLISTVSSRSSWDEIYKKWISYLASAVLIDFDGEELLKEIDVTLQKCIGRCTDLTTKEKLNAQKTGFQKLPEYTDNPYFIMMVEELERLK